MVEIITKIFKFTKIVWPIDSHSCRIDSRIFQVRRAQTRYWNWNEGKLFCKYPNVYCTSILIHNDFGFFKLKKKQIPKDWLRFRIVSKYLPLNIFIIPPFLFLGTSSSLEKRTTLVQRWKFIIEGDDHYFEKIASKWIEGIWKSVNSLKNFFLRK